MKTLNRVRFLRGAFAGLLLAAAIGSCGKAADEEPLQIDSNTNWLKRCDADAECSGSLRCYCGQCSQPCSESDECQLLAGAECASSGGAVCTAQPSAGGLCVLGCAEDADCGQEFTCTERQCVPKPCAGGFQSWDDVYLQVASDLARHDPDDGPFLRYVSFANHWSYRSCGSTLTTERQGLSKLINSLSSNSVVSQPTPIDVNATLYRIDLRDYGWDLPVEVLGNAYTDVWEALVGNNRFAVPLGGSEAGSAIQDSGTVVPVMFANSLIGAALNPDVYYGILNMPQTYAGVFADLEVDAGRSDVRAGHELDGPNIIATHWELETRAGYVWDFGVVAGPAGALFSDPLQVPAGEHQLIFTVPNGLQAFAYTNASGARVNDTRLFLDTQEADFRAIVPRTPLRRDSPRPVIVDEVRDYLANNPARFNAQTTAAIVAAYPGADAIDQLINSDYERFTRPALQAAGVDPQLPEPTTSTYDDYAGDVTLEDAAGDFLISREELLDNLPLLDPRLSMLRTGSMTRDDFALFFYQAMCVLTAVNENVPVGCP